MTGVTEIRPAEDAEPARWLLRSDVDWWDLVRYGPPGFAVYVRIAFPLRIKELDGSSFKPSRLSLPTRPRLPVGMPPSGRDGPVWTHERAQWWRFLIERWCCSRGRSKHSGTHQVWRGTAQAADDGQEPHLVWPARPGMVLGLRGRRGDRVHRGVLRRRVPGVWLEHFPGAVRRVQYGDPTPAYRDET